MIMKLIFDTNFLIDLVKFKIDFEEINKFGKFEFFTLDSVIEELNNIANSTGKKGKYAKIALKLIEIKKIKILKTTKKTDESILEINEKVVVATNDKNLRKKLKEKGIKTFYIRGKKYLAMG